MTIVKEVIPFSFRDSVEVFSCPQFQVFQKILVTQEHDPSPTTAPVFTLQMSNWVNVVPVTSDRHILLVEQHRFGVDMITLETPGGVIDPGEERDPTLTALRELEEETAHSSKRLLGLPSFFPNPPLQDNKVHFFIAFDVEPLLQRPSHEDPLERICVRKIPINEVYEMVKTGQIKHSLCALALLLAAPYIKQN